MEFPERVSEKIGAVIAVQLEDVSPQKLAEIKYGIAVFITNFYKILLIFILAIFLNIFNYALIAYVSFGILRTFASGVHAKREWTCLPVSTILLFGNVYLGLFIKLNFYAVTIIFFLCFLAVLIYAPADTEERPIVSSKQRKKLRLMSCFSVVALYITSILYLNTSISSIISFAVLIEAILILPIAYKLAGSMYNVGINIYNKKEV